MHDVFLRPSASIGLACCRVLSFGQTEHCRRPQRAPCWNPSTPCLDVVCGKRKGKDKGKSKPARPAQPTQQAPGVLSEQAPTEQIRAPRITPANTSNRPLKSLKRSITVIRQQEARGGNGAAPRAQQAVLTPAFRRRPVDTAEFKQQRAESEAEAERNRQRAGQSASFASLYGTRGQKTPSVLIVDGYNVLGELAKRGRSDAEPFVTDSCDLADANAFDASARAKLELQLVAYSHSREVKVVLVFDAMGGTMSRTTVRTTNAGAIDVVYCAAEEADTWIVQETCRADEVTTIVQAARLVTAGAKSVLVATSDQCIKDCLSGAFFVSSASLLKEITKVEKEALLKQQDSLRSMSRLGIGAAIAADNPALLKLLNDMR